MFSKNSLLSVVFLLLTSTFFSQVSINLCGSTTTTSATSGNLYDSGGARQEIIVIPRAASCLLIQVVQQPYQYHSVLSQPKADLII